MPADRLILALAQLEAVPGDVEGHAARLAAARARAAGADLVLAPELYLSGFAPLDLVRRPAFVEACRAACEALARLTADGGPALLVGLPWAEGGALHNAVALLDGGRIEALRFKTALTHEEAARFRPGPDPGPAPFRGARLGLVIGEDIERPDTAECLAETGADLLISLQASAYARDGFARRQSHAVARVVETGLPLVALNGIGAVDEGIADGGSFALNDDCSVAVQLPGFAEGFARLALAREDGAWACEPGERALVGEGDEGDAAACVLAIRAFLSRSGAQALTVAQDGPAAALLAALAAEAVGAERLRSAPGPGTLTLSALDKTALWLGDGGLEGDFAPFLDLYASDLARLAAGRGLGLAPPDAASDAILRGLLDGNARIADLVGAGHDPAHVAGIEAALARGDARRRRAPPGLRLGPAPRAPLLHRFRDPGAPAFSPDPALAPKRPRGGAERFEE